MSTVLYKRATFVTQLPTAHLYSHSHGWMAKSAGAGLDGPWRVGYTKFALRMLGELVDVQLGCLPGSAIQPGDVLGSVEGFKAISDIFCIGSGQFLQANPALNASLEKIVQSPYDIGWLYEFTGQPEPRILDVDGYRAVLDATIDRLLAKQQQQQ